VKLAIDEGWLGPAARLALGAAAGVGLLFAGLRAQRAEMRPLAHGLFGAGIGVLYVSTYVAFASHGLIPRELAFASMVAVTITGCALAIRYDAQAVAVLALLGGLVTPVAVASGDSSRDALFTYLMVLDLGVVVLAMVRRWRGLELIAMAGTWVLFSGWLERHHDAAMWQAELAWLVGFHVLFLVLPFGYHLRRSIAVAPGRFRTALANAAAVAVFATVIVDHRQDVLGVIALVMAATYHALGMVVRRRLPGDGRAHFGFVALAVIFATSSVPLLLRDHGVTLAWALEAPVLLALGYHYRHFPIRLAGLGVLALAAVNLGIAHWPHHELGFTPFANLGYIGAMAVPAGAALFALVHRVTSASGDARDRWLGTIAALAAAGLTLSLAHSELAQWFTLAGRVDTARAVVPIVWAIGALLVIPAAARGDRVALIATTTFAAIATRLVFLAYKLPADATMELGLNLRFAGAVLTCLAAGALAVVVTRRDRDRGQLIWAAALSGLGIAIGAEAYLHFAALDGAAVEVARAGRRAQTALSIAWSGYAAVLLAAGFTRGHRALRLAGLGLLGVVATKLVLVDLAGAAPVYRVMSFLIVGALMIAASFAYHRFERR
jgi:uncharacterized membrane protein